ncbi:uncharacterized protein LOC124153702 [Ischnura elegans]|uniref:uncharacterized protein LOC124153702 n=1 Tax=Ischnura elegans TaxID=197161 RepID=UPI001ED898D1|nr:uncharacterized protein LOC124153702 [Ischnura elegans]
MRRPRKQTPNTRRKGSMRDTDGPKVTMAATAAARRLREDMWAYELIVGSSYGNQSCSGAGSSYYLSATWLMQELYASCYQTWARCLKSEGFPMENPSSYCHQRPHQNNCMNVPVFQPPNVHTPDSKNLLLLSTVADLEHRQRFSQTNATQWISDDFLSSQASVPRSDSGFGRNFMANETSYDSKDMMLFSNAVFIKTELDE